jgi:AcrR family transcriptional regulator
MELTDSRSGICVTVTPTSIVDERDAMSDDNFSSGVSDGDDARIRLLDVAAGLFDRYGLHGVSLQRVIDEAGIPESTLADAFGGRDELVRAYLRLRHSRTRERIARGLAQYRTPRDRLIGVFDIQGQAFSEPAFRGCVFVAAKAQALPGDLVDEVTGEYRAWLHELFIDLVSAAKVPNPEGLAEQLVLLYDGAGISAWMDQRPATVNTSRTIATALIDAALSDR